jgi:hypothetical protein
MMLRIYPLDTKRDPMTVKADAWGFTDEGYLVVKDGERLVAEFAPGTWESIAEVEALVL